MAIDLDPNDYDAYLDHGTAKGCLEEYDDAQFDYDCAIGIKLACAEGLVSRGSVNMLLRLNEEANNDFNQVS